MKKLILTHVVLALSAAFVLGQEKLPQFGKDPVKAIVKKMTLEEKARVVVGKGFSMPG